MVVTGHHYGDELTRLLEHAGYDVVRGSKPAPGATRPVLPEERWASVLPDTAVVVVSHRDGCPGGMIEAAPRLRGIVSTVIGVDTIDMGAADRTGLVVAHGAMEENYLGVSEATVMLIAALLLELVPKENVLRNNIPPGTTMLGRMVRGKNIGLVGLGRTARGVVERLAGWDVRLTAHDPYVSAAPRGVELVGLRELLQASDVVSVHVALSAETHQLMGEDQFALMKPGSYLINTSRGGVVDERALEDALRAGRLAGAALDVFETEPLPADSGLRWLPNVILTPHMVGHSRELLEAIPRVAFENVVRILHGRTPLYVQNPRVLEAWGRRLQRLPP